MFDGFTTLLIPSANKVDRRTSEIWNDYESMYTLRTKAYGR